MEGRDTSRNAAPQGPMRALASTSEQTLVWALMFERKTGSLQLLSIQASESSFAWAMEWDTDRAVDASRTIPAPTAANSRAHIAQQASLREHGFILIIMRSGPLRGYICAIRRMLLGCKCRSDLNSKYLNSKYLNSKYLNSKYLNSKNPNTKYPDSEYPNSKYPSC